MTGKRDSKLGRVLMVMLVDGRILPSPFCGPVIDRLTVMMSMNGKSMVRSQELPWLLNLESPLALGSGLTKKFTPHFPPHTSRPVSKGNGNMHKRKEYKCPPSLVLSVFQHG